MKLFKKMASNRQLKWREPWLMRLRLHHDFPTRLLMSTACSIAVGSVFTAVGWFEVGGPEALIAGAIGAVIIGGMISLTIMTRPESLMSGDVRLRDDELRRVRHTFGFLSWTVTERWTCPGLTCAVVPGEALYTTFSVMVLPRSDGRMSLVGIPTGVSFKEVVERLGAQGAKVVLAPELAATVRADRPYRPWVVICVVAAASLITLAAAICVLLQALV